LDTNDEEETIEGQAISTPDPDDQAKSVIEHADDDDDELSAGDEPNMNGNPSPLEELLEELDDDDLELEEE
jgi:hypothetical protein